MKLAINLFKNGYDVTINLSDLDKFREEVAKLPELYEYYLLYRGDEVTIKRTLN